MKFSMCSIPILHMLGGNICIVHMAVPCHIMVHHILEYQFFNGILIFLFNQKRLCIHINCFNMMHMYQIHLLFLLWLLLSLQKWDLPALTLKFLIYILYLPRMVFKNHLYREFHNHRLVYLCRSLLLVQFIHNQVPIILADNIYIIIYHGSHNNHSLNIRLIQVLVSKPIPIWVTNMKIHMVVHKGLLLRRFHLILVMLNLTLIDSFHFLQH